MLSVLRYVRVLDNVKLNQVAGVVRVTVPGIKGYVIELKDPHSTQVGKPVTPEQASLLCTWKPGQPEPDVLLMLN